MQMQRFPGPPGFVSRETSLGEPKFPMMHMAALSRFPGTRRMDDMTHLVVQYAFHGNARNSRCVVSSRYGQDMMTYSIGIHAPMCGDTPHFWRPPHDRSQAAFEVGLVEVVKQLFQVPGLPRPAGHRQNFRQLGGQPLEDPDLCGLLFGTRSRRRVQGASHPKRQIVLNLSRRVLENPRRLADPMPLAANQPPGLAQTRWEFEGNPVHCQMGG